jgi:oligoendopeptidase F
MTDTTSQSPWSLADLYQGFDDPQYEAAFDEIRQGAERFQAFREQLVPEISEELFISIITEFEHFYRLISRLGGFTQLAFAGDTQDQAAQAQMARADQFQAEISNQTLFFNLWWKALDDANAERLLKAAGDYRYWLVAMRNFKDYTLSEPEEKIINIKDVTGVSALNMLYDSITNRYTFKIEVEGEMKELTRGEIAALVREPDPELRARAYQTMFAVYQADAPILGQIYQTLVRDWRNENLNLRGFKSPISVRNLVNDIPDAVVETCWRSPARMRGTSTASFA